MTTGCICCGVFFVPVLWLAGADPRSSNVSNNLTGVEEVGLAKEMGDTADADVEEDITVMGVVAEAAGGDGIALPLLLACEGVVVFVVPAFFRAWDTL